MRNVKGFEEFNEGFKSLMKKIGSVVNKGIDLITRGKGDSVLGKYDIEMEKVDNYTYKFYHDDKLIARIFQPEGEEGSDMGRPVFMLYIYMYDSEVKNTKNRSIKGRDPDEDIQNELSSQRSRPYWRAYKKAFTTQWLIQFLYEWWAVKTKSGRATSSRLNKPEQKTSILREL
jgi:hypothetical protein